MKFLKPTLVTITAPTCSGKTYLIEKLASLGFNRIVGFTTREPRQGEVEGKDYYFITMEKALQLGEEGKLAETASFRGNSYGVTHEEMEGKMSGEMTPVVILEPSGLQTYEKYCAQHGYGIFKVYVSVAEATKIQRLNQRTTEDLLQADNEDNIMKIVKTHSDRLLSITGDERLWPAKNSWDAIVPGDNINSAIESISQGIKWRNSQSTYSL